MQTSSNKKVFFSLSLSLECVTGSYTVHLYIFVCLPYLWMDGFDGWIDGLGR